MTFDHIFLIVSLATIVFLFGSISLLSFVKNRFRKNPETFDKIHNFAKKLDKSSLPTILLGISGVSFLVWLITRVVISYQ